MAPTTTLRAAALVLLSGCGLGFGTPYPGAAQRYREYYACRAVYGTTCVYHPTEDRRSETGGGGQHGFVVGMGMGASFMRLGENDTGDGMAIAVRGEYMYSLTRWLGVGVIGGLAMDFATVRELDVGQVSYPVGAQVSVVPIAPLLLRAGAGVAKGTVTVGDELETEIETRELFAGAGMTVPFPGLHWVVLVEWRRRSTVDVMTGAGMEPYGADSLMFSMWQVF